MKADMFIFARLTNPRPAESEGKEKARKKREDVLIVLSFCCRVCVASFRKLILGSICYHSLSDMMEVDQTKAGANRKRFLI